MDETTTDGTETDTDCNCECPGEDTEGGCTQSERGCAVAPDAEASGAPLMLALVVVGWVTGRALRSVRAATRRA